MKDHVSCLAQTAARHEIVEGILSPEGRRLLWSPDVALPQRRIRRFAGATTPMHFKKTFAGVEPGEDDASSPRKIVKRIARVKQN